MPAQNVQTEPNGARDAWLMACLQRADGPPLRFKGTILFAKQDGSVFAEVWKRKKGGLVLSYSELHDGQIRSHSLVLDDFSEVGHYLEDLCDHQCVTQRTVLADVAVGRLLKSMSYQQSFHQLVGDLLADIPPGFSASDDTETKEGFGYAN